MVLGKPEVFIGMAQNKFVDGKLTDEPTRKFMTDQMVAFQDWIVRMQRAFA
jgi:chromate reductase